MNRYSGSYPTKVSHDTSVVVDTKRIDGSHSVKVSQIIISANASVCLGDGRCGASACFSVTINCAEVKAAVLSKADTSGK